MKKKQCFYKNSLLVRGLFSLPAKYIFFFSCFLLAANHHYGQSFGAMDKHELKAYSPEMDRILKQYHKDFIKKVIGLYRWNEVNEKLAKDLGLGKEEVGRFTKHLAYKGVLHISDFYNQVYSGKITEKNTLEYWLGQVTYIENLFETEYSAFKEMQKQKNDLVKRAPLNNNPQPNTGGSSCNNLDFSAGNESGWTGQWNNQGSSDPSSGVGYGNLTVNGLNNSPFNSMGYLHELCNGGNDPWIPITRVPPGHSFSVRLGDDDPYAQGVASYNHQTIQNTFLVTQVNSIITYWYAANLLQTQGAPHPQSEQPYFKTRMYDSLNNEILSAHYDVDATAAGSIGGFNYTADGFGYEFVWKNWTQRTISLNNYIGQMVTIKFETSDCDQGGHFGYAYITVDCGAGNIITASPSSCAKDSTTLTAPAGLNSYSWTTSGGGFIGSTNSQSVKINSPGSYTVTMITATDTFAIDTIINGATWGVPLASFTTQPGCLNSPVQFIDQSSNPVTGATVTGYSWDFDDGSTSTAFNPVHAYPNAGPFAVHYTVTSSAGCTATYSASVNTNGAFTNNPQSVCSGSSYAINGHNYSVDGVYTDTLQGQGGCDSIIVTQLTIHSLPVVNVDFSNIDTLCVNAGIITLSGENPVGGTYTSAYVSANSFDAGAAGAGTHFVNYTYTDANSCINSVTDSIYVDLCLGINNLNISELKLYPNPTQDFFTIENISSPATIKLYDLSGRIVLAQKVSSSTTTNSKCTINTSNLQNGIFLVEVIDEKSGTRSFGRVVVNR